MRRDVAWLRARLKLEMLALEEACNGPLQADFARQVVLLKAERDEALVRAERAERARDELARRTAATGRNR